MCVVGRGSTIPCVCMYVRTCMCVCYCKRPVLCPVRVRFVSQGHGVRDLVNTLLLSTVHRCPAKLLSPTRLSENPRNFVLTSFVLEATPHPLIYTIALSSSTAAAAAALTVVVVV